MIGHQANGVYNHRSGCLLLRVPRGIQRQDVNAQQAERLCLLAKPKLFTGPDDASITLEPVSSSTMQLFCFLFLTLFSALSRASSYCTGKPSVAGYCRPETWEGRTTDGAPAVEGASGCEAACAGVASDTGDWFANLTGAAAGEKRSLVGYDCTFSIGRGPGQADPLIFRLANQDILDIYAGAIRRFARNGRVAAAGTMRCEGKEVAWWVD